MPTNRIVLLFLILTATILSCESADCDREYFEKISGLEMLKEAEMLQCENSPQRYHVATFQLNKKQVRELLDSGDFEPVRSSLEMVDFPLFWVNRIFAEIDELSSYSFDYDQETSCSLTLKEDDRLLLVFISYPNWSDD